MARPAVLPHPPPRSRRRPNPPKAGLKMRPSSSSGTVINSSLELPVHSLEPHLLTIMGKILSTRGMVAMAHAKRKFTVEMVKGLFLRTPRGKSVKIGYGDADGFRDCGALTRRRHGLGEVLQRGGGDARTPPCDRRKERSGCWGFGGRIASGSSPPGSDVPPLAGEHFRHCDREAHTINELQRVNRQLDQKIQDLNTLFETGKEFSALLDPERQIPAAGTLAPRQVPPHPLPDQPPGRSPT